MQFLNPLALIGLAAAAIPLALHLLNRGRPRAVAFSNLTFLRQLHQSRMRSVRLRQWLVLLLRTLALIALVLAFARPAIHSGDGHWLAGARPVTAVFLIDQSYSVSARLGSTSLFDELRRRAQQALQLFDDDDRVYLIGFEDGATEPVTGSLQRLAQHLEEMSPGQGGTDVGRALTHAYQLLAQTPDHTPELYLFTDGARPGWTPASISRPKDLRTFVLPPARRPAGNLALVDVVFEPWLITPGARLDLSVRVHQYGPVPADPPAVDLYVDGERVQRRTLDLSTIGDATGEPRVLSVPFTIAPRHAGRLRAFAQIQSDALTADDRIYFALDAPDTIRVLLLGGTTADTYYPRRALAAAVDGDRSLLVRTRQLAAATSQDWEWAKVLILCGAQRMAEADQQRLLQHVERGGGVILFPGDQPDLRHLNRDVLPSLLPVSISGIHTGGSGCVLDTTRLHPILFRHLDRRHTPSTSASFELVTDSGVDVLATCTDGRPVVVEGQLAEGRVVLWSIPLNLQWSQWPESGWFLPVLQRLTRHLALTHTGDDGYRVADHAWRRLPGVAADTRVQAQAPSGQRRYVEAERVLGERRWKIPDLNEAGFWSLGSDAEGVAVPAAVAAQSVFAVNVDSTEADLRPVGDDEMMRILGADAMRIDASTSLETSVTQRRTGREMWRALLALAGLLLLVELWISRSPAMKTAADASSVG